MIAGGGGFGLTIEQPENNIVRGAYYALASALGGTQTMALCSYDEAYTIPSQHAARLSLRTMQIMIEEIGLADTVDPLAGSYFIESMTNEMEARIRTLLDRLDSEGSIVQAVSDGRVQAAVNAQAYERELKVQRGERKKVGVNCYVEEEEARDVAFHPYRQQEAERQIERLNGIRRKRDGAAVTVLLDEVKRVAAAKDNVMPAIIDAVEAYATVGEICGVLKDVYGTYNETIRF